MPRLPPTEELSHEDVDPVATPVGAAAPDLHLAVVGEEVDDLLHEEVVEEVAVHPLQVLDLSGVLQNLEAPLGPRQARFEGLGFSHRAIETEDRRSVTSD